LYSQQSHVANLPKDKISSSAFFISDKLREELQRKNEALQMSLNPTSCFFNLGDLALYLPAQVHMYHSLYPLENTSERRSNIFGYPTSVFKAIRAVDGKCYCLQRVENYLLGSESSISLIEQWRKVRHSGIVSVCEGFTTKAFGDTCCFYLK
jgi:PAB-dependent poly(A)-specific ribonuclease subunit 3